MSDIKLACDVAEQVRAICDKHGNQPGELINILHEAQHLHGYLPEEMLQVRVKCSENDRMETTVLPAGHHYIPVELDEVVFFVRKGHILPIARGGDSIQNVASVNFADLRLFAHAPDGAAYEYYTDDGETKDYDKPEHFVHITLDADGNAESDCENVKVEG